MKKSIELVELSVAVDFLDAYLSKPAEQLDLDELRPLVHKVSEAYINLAMEEQNSELLTP